MDSLIWLVNPPETNLWGRAEFSYLPTDFLFYSGPLKPSSKGKKTLIGAKFF